MRIAVILALLAAGFTLSGCKTDGSLSNPFAQSPAAKQALVSPSDSEVTGSIGAKSLPVAGEVALGKEHYRAGRYELAEKHFRSACERDPKDAQAWIGLAASYDRLHVFDFADRAYERALALDGASAEILNNQGYSYMLRGDFKRAREILHAAQAKAPGNPYVKSNLQELAEKTRAR